MYKTPLVVLLSQAVNPYLCCILKWPLDFTQTYKAVQAAISGKIVNKK